MPLPHIEEMGVEHPLPHHALSSPTTPGPRRLVHTNIYLASIASGRLSNSPWLLLFVFPIRWSLATSRPAWCTRWTRSGELLSRSTLANRSVLCLWGFVESLIASGYEIYELSVSNHNTLWAILDTNPQSRPLQGVRLAAGGVGAPLAGAMPPRGTREIDSATIPEWARELSDTQYAISVRHLRFDDDFELEDDSDRDLINQVLDRSGPNILPDRGQDPHRCPAMCDTVPMPGYRHCHFHLHYACKQVQHPTKSKWMEQLSWLRKFAREVPDNLWVVDVEYSMFNFACPVAWDITFRRFSDRRVILHSRINYAGATVDELIGLYYSVCPPGFRLAAQTESRYGRTVHVRSTYSPTPGYGPLSNGSTRQGLLLGLHSNRYELDCSSKASILSLIVCWLTGYPWIYKWFGRSWQELMSRSVPRMGRKTSKWARSRTRAYSQSTPTIWRAICFIASATG